MAYLTIKQVKQQYSVADKSIRMLFEPTSEPEPITATKVKVGNNGPS